MQRDYMTRVRRAMSKGSRCLYLLLVLLVIILTGCSPKRQLTEQERNDKEIRERIVYRDRVQRDSVFVHDSIYMMVKGDTVFRDKIKYVNVFKYKTDTAYVCRIDTMYMIKKEVFREELSFRERMKIKSFPYLCTGLVLLAGVAYVGWKLK